jgi:hypothetical protein
MSRHIKLNNSSVSDYFKAAALEKGWIQEKVIEKKANKNVDISDNLDVNISTLILKLKEAGLSDLSNELNENFLYYKKASAGLYNVTKNEYNKLIHLSHPKGSVKLQNMSGDCVVEDLYATQKALMDLLKEKKRVKKAQNNSVYSEFTIFKTIANQIDQQKTKLISLLNKIPEGEKEAVLNIANNIKPPFDSANIYTYQNEVKKSYNSNNTLFNQILNTTSGYFSSEKLLDKYSLTNGFSTIVTNFANLYGKIYVEISNVTEKDKVLTVEEQEKENEKQKQDLESKQYEDNKHKTDFKPNLNNKISNLINILMSVYNRYKPEEAKDLLNYILKRKNPDFYENLTFDQKNDLIKDMNETIAEWDVD